jgi:hypothetical protein
MYSLRPTPLPITAIQDTPTSGLLSFEKQTLDPTTKYFFTLTSYKHDAFGNIISNSISTYSPVAQSNLNEMVPFIMYIDGSANTTNPKQVKGDIVGSTIRMYLSPLIPGHIYNYSFLLRNEDGIATDINPGPLYINQIPTITYTFSTINTGTLLFSTIGNDPKITYNINITPPITNSTFSNLNSVGMYSLYGLEPGTAYICTISAGIVSNSISFFAQSGVVTVNKPTVTQIGTGKATISFPISENVISYQLQLPLLFDTNNTCTTYDSYGKTYQYDIDGNCTVCTPANICNTITASTLFSVKTDVVNNMSICRNDISDNCYPVTQLYNDFENNSLYTYDETISWYCNTLTNTCKLATGGLCMIVDDKLTVNTQLYPQLYNDLPFPINVMATTGISLVFKTPLITNFSGFITTGPDGNVIPITTLPSSINGTTTILFPPSIFNLHNQIDPESKKVISPISLLTIFWKFIIIQFEYYFGI